MEEIIMKKFENTKKRANLAPLILAATMLLSACGSEEPDISAPVVESIEDVSDQPAAQTDNASDNTSDNASYNASDNTSDNSGPLTEDQAYAAVINYNKSIGSGYDGEINSDGYSEYWDVSTEDGKIVVLYRSYTAAQIRYYVDPVSGETYVTELVPGIIDEEQENGERFNARDFLAGPGANDGTAPGASGDSPAPVEYETADGFMGSFLLSSDRDKIDTTSDYGVLYRVVYQAPLKGDDLTACGSMDYRNSKDQDPITISSDVTHVFKVDDNTVYMKGDEEALAKFGYNSSKHYFKQVCKEFAEMLYKKVFVEKLDAKEKKMYKDALESLGIKVKEPKAGQKKDTPYPPVSAIIAKLMG